MPLPQTRLVDGPDILDVDCSFAVSLAQKHGLLDLVPLEITSGDQESEQTLLLAVWASDCYVKPAKDQEETTHASRAAREKLGSDCLIPVQKRLQSRCLMNPE